MTADIGNEKINPEEFDRMHREVGDFLQAEVDRGSDNLMEIGFHEDEIPEPRGTMDPAEDELARAEALSTGQIAIKHETQAQEEQSRESRWTTRAQKLYEQGEISSAQADIMSGLGGEMPDMGVEMPASDGGHLAD